MAHQFHSTSLREYDIRGVVGSTLTEDDAWAIGRSFATIVRRAGGKTVAVGYDGRLSSPMLEAAPDPWIDGNGRRCGARWPRANPHALLC